MDKSTAYPIDVRKLTPSTMAALIDHTLLKPEAITPQFEQLCQEAVAFHFATVCVNPSWIRFCSERLAGSGVLLCTVIGFPLGNTLPENKVDETLRAIDHGADEIDMVLHAGWLKSSFKEMVLNDIAGVVKAASPNTVKVILETCLLTEEEKILSCELARLAGAHFVKTSTGFGKAGATIEDVSLMRRCVGDALGVKAAGGIRDLPAARAIIAAGANRIGTSSGVNIINAMRASLDQMA